MLIIIVLVGAVILLSGCNAPYIDEEGDLIVGTSCECPTGYTYDAAQDSCIRNADWECPEGFNCADQPILPCY